MEAAPFTPNRTGRVLSTIYKGPRGHGSTEVKYHVSFSGVVPTAEVAQEFQAKIGYHPAGYGFHDFRIMPDGTCRWSRFDNCD